MYEDELIPLFEKCGEVWDLRLMMDPLTGQNRGYAFVTFTTREAANEAVKEVFIPFILYILMKNLDKKHCKMATELKNLTIDF